MTGYLILDVYIALSVVALSWIIKESLSEGIESKDIPFVFVFTIFSPITIFFFAADDLGLFDQKSKPKVLTKKEIKKLEKYSPGQYLQR